MKKEKAKAIRSFKERFTEDISDGIYNEELTMKEISDTFDSAKQKVMEEVWDLCRKASM